MSRTSSLRLLVSVCLLAMPIQLGGNCSGGPTPPPVIVITSPANGTFTNASSVTVTGAVFNVGPNQITDVKVNGVSVLPLNGAQFSTVVNLDPNVVFNPIVAELQKGLVKVRDRHTLIVGDGVNTGFVLDGDYSPEGVGLRFNETGLAQIAPIVESLSGDALDIGTLLAAQNPILDNECVVDSPLGCLNNADVSVVDVSFSSFSLATDAKASGVIDADIVIDDFFVEVDLTVRDQVAVEFVCGLELEATSTTISGSFDLQPLAGTPSQVDVNMVGQPQITLSNFNSTFVGGICDDPILGDIIQLLASPSMLEGLVADGFEQNLSDPDGTGPADSPIAAAIQASLAGIDIAGPVGAAIGVTMDAPIVMVAEDDDGLTLSADAAITNSMPAPGTPDLPASYHVVESFPTFGPLTPVGSLPYGLALGISTSGFNQLLKGMIEGGLLQTQLTEITVAGQVLPLTAGVLRLFIPEFNNIPAATAFTLHIEPEVAPVMTGNPGPNGELVEFKIAGLRVEFRRAGDGTRFLGVVVDVTTGVDLAFVDGEVAFSLGTLDTVDVTITENPIKTNETALLNLLPSVFPALLPSLADSLGSFPIPGFLGLDLQPVEVSKVGSYLGIFADLAVIPTTQIQNVVITDFSSGDFRNDPLIGDTSEWRHRLTGKGTTNLVTAKLKGMLGADACCTLEDETATATASYRVEFDVVTVPDETWTLDIDHAILGAFTLFDEGVDGGGIGEFTSPGVSASYDIGGGPVAFDFERDIGQPPDQQLAERQQRRVQWHQWRLAERQRQHPRDPGLQLRAAHQVGLQRRLPGGAG